MHIQDYTFTGRAHRKHPLILTRVVLRNAVCCSIYLQQPLNDTVVPAIVRDFVQFNWKWVTDQQKELCWGPLTSNLLLISEEGESVFVHFSPVNFRMRTILKTTLLRHTWYH